MNRSKSNDKLTTTGGQIYSSTRYLRNNAISLPFEASEDVRVLPGAPRRIKTTPALAALEPFMPLLPDLSGVAIGQQKALHNCLYSAGVTAALSLQKNGASATSALLNIDRESSEWKELFNSFGKTLDFDDSIDTYRKLSQKLAIPGTRHLLFFIEELRSDSNGQLMKMVTNEVAAFALTAFASMIYRRPFTKQMEIIMAPAQDSDALSSDDEQSPVFASDDAGIECCDNENECDCEGGDDKYEYIGDEDCLFRYVCSIGYEDLAKLLLTLRQSPEFSKSKDSTPLMEACCGGYSGIVRALIEAGANVNAVSETSSNTALIYACAAQHPDCVRELLHVEYINLELRNDCGHTALMEAASAGNIEIMRMLIERGATPISIVNNSDFKESALTLAAYKGHIDAVKYLISVFPSDISESHRDEEFHTALMEASMDGHVEVAEVLLEAGAKTNLRSDSFESPLTLAACGGHVELASILLSFGAKLEDSNDEGYTPLMEASREGHHEVVELLLDHGANVHAKLSNSDTSLSLAASGGYMNVVELLISHGSDLVSGSPLYEATQEGHTEVACYLIKHLKQLVSSPEIVTQLNNALICAAQLNNFIICNALMDSMADPDCYSKDGTTPLMEAAKHGSLHIIEVLLRKKANVNLISRNGEWTALSLAASNGHAEVVRYLLRHDADPKQRLGDSSSCLLEATKNGHLSCVEALLDYKSHRVPEQASQSEKFCKGKHACQNANTPSNIILAKTKSILQKDGVVKLDSVQTHSGSTELSTKQQEQTQSSRSTTLSSKAFQTSSSSSSNPPFNTSTSQLFRALATAASSSASYNSYDELLFAQFLQRSCIPTKKRDAMTEEELNAFTEMLQHQFRTVFPTGQVDAAALMSATELQSLASQSANADVNTPLKLDHEQLDKELTSKLKIKEGKEITSLRGPDNENIAFKQESNLNDVSSSSQMSQETSSCMSNLYSHTRTPSPSPSVSSRGDVRSTTPQANSASSAFTARTSQSPCELALLDAQIEGNADTALTVACVSGNVEIANLLIQRGFDIEHRDKKGFTPLILCATGGHAEICRLLLEAGCQVDAQADRTKDTALSLACSGGRKEIVEMLLTYGANKEHRNISDYTPLSLAASGGYVDIIQLLLHHGAEINSRTGSKLGISPLMLAAMNGHEAATRLLLNNGSDINAQIETNRNTALTLACFQGRTEVVRLLLQYGASLDHRAKTGLTPLMEAANGGYVDVGTLLLAAGADVNAPPVMTSRDTALTIAADKGHAAFVELIIHAGANINVRNKKGSSALWLACAGGHLETVKTLINHHADVDEQDNRGMSPLMIAFRKGHVQIVEFIVNHVTQFPNDQECERYISTLSDDDLISKCNKCFAFISQSKTKQAVQADRAAESLLHMLALEEAQAELKKKSKQRQKEKKKAKKNAKKQSHADDDEQNEEEGTSKKLDEKNTDPKNIQSVLDESRDDNLLLKNDDEESEKKIHTETALAEDMRVPYLDSIYEASEISPNKVNTDKFDNSRLSPTPNTSGNGLKSLSRKECPPQKNVRRSTRRGTRGGSFILENKSSSKVSDNNNPKHSEETDMWVHPSKRRTTTIRANKLSSTSHCQFPRLLGQIATNDNFMMSIDEWVADPNAASSKRKLSHTLSVSSQSIARVIGRSGSNINAIREATNAHIEVEKMTTKREQATRSITIKGTPESIRNSVCMIEMLIKEQDLHINEILRRVIGSNTVPTSTDNRSSSAESPIQTQHSLINESNLTKTSQQNVTIKPSAQLPVFLEPTVNATSNVTNIWHQRAAIREQQKVVASDTESDKHKTTFAICSDINNEATDLLHPVERSAITESAQFTNNDTQQRPYLSQERKAPGYERPNSSTSGTIATTSVVPAVRLQSSITATTSFAAINDNVSTFTDIGLNDKDLPDFDKFLSENKRQSISDIWNNCESDLASSPSALNFTGLFGNGILDSKTWLSSSTEISEADYRTSNLQRYKNAEKFSTFDGPTNDWLSGIFPTLEDGVSSAISSSSTLMKMIDRPSTSTNADNIQKDTSAIGVNRWDLAGNTWDASNPGEMPKSCLTSSNVASNLLNWRTPNSDLSNGNTLYGDAFASTSGSMNEMNPQLQYAGSFRQSAIPQQTFPSHLQDQGSRFDNISQQQPKFVPNIGKEMSGFLPTMSNSRAYSTIRHSQQKQLPPSQSNLVYQGFMHPPQNQQQCSNQLQMRDNNLPMNSTGYNMLPFQQQPFFQASFASTNGPTVNQHTPSQSTFISKNQAIFNGINSGFVHPPPGFIRQPVTNNSAMMSTNSFYGNQSIQPDGQKRASSNCTQNPRSYYNNFYYNGNS